MAVGNSGRIVIEIDPKRKARIYAALKTRGLTLREWFLLKAEKELLGAPKRELAVTPKRRRADG